MSNFFYILILQIFIFISSQFTVSDFFKNLISPPLSKEEDPTYDPESWGSKYSAPETENLDMGLCSCDLTNLCDYRCCCDSSCSSDLVEGWRNQSLCLNNEKKRMAQFMCDSSEKDISQSDKAVLVKDQIFNMMCIFYDRSGDMGEFYQSNENDETTGDALITDWNKKFFINDSNSNNQEGYSYSYKRIIKNKTGSPLAIYAPDSSGNCVKNKVLRFMENIDTTCIIDINSLSNEAFEIYKNEKEKETINFEFFEEINNTLNVANIYNYIFKYKIEKDENDEKDEKKKKEQITITEIVPKYSAQVASSDKNLRIIINWVNENTDSGSSSSSTTSKGYLQGTPLIFRIKDKNQASENPFSDDDKGKCGTDNPLEPSEINIKFKNNLIYSCYTENTLDTSIYKLIKNDTKLEIGKKRNALEEDEWIPVVKEVPNNDLNQSINIVLEIITTKSGISGREDLIVEAPKLHYSFSEETYGGYNIVRFQVVFAEVTYNMIENEDSDISSRKNLPASIFQNNSGSFLKSGGLTFSFIFILINALNYLLLFIE